MHIHIYKMFYTFTVQKFGVGKIFGKRSLIPSKAKFEKQW